MASSQEDISKLQIPLYREDFLTNLLRHLSGALQDVIGLEDASGFISIVGQRMGADIGDSYLEALKVSRLNRQQVAAVLVDLKQRINGNFSIVSQTEEKIVLKTTSCPFGQKVVGRPSLCMMTTNVFGTIAAENLGYAKVALEQTIADGAKGCRVVIYLAENKETLLKNGNEYFKG